DGLLALLGWLAARVLGLAGTQVLLQERARFGSRGGGFLLVVVRAARVRERVLGVVAQHAAVLAELLHAGLERVDLLLRDAAVLGPEHSEHRRLDLAELRFVGGLAVVEDARVEVGLGDRELQRPLAAEAPADAAALLRLDAAVAGQERERVVQRRLRLA